MASTPLSETINMPLPELPTLPRSDRHWQSWVSGMISIALFTTILWKLHDFGFVKSFQTMPSNPLFWLTLAVYYLALPFSEWLIFRRLWDLPAGGFIALLRKLISNEVLFGYSGEVYFYTWARRHARLIAAPFGAIKDVSILSAIAGNLMTLAMLAVAWPIVGNIVPELHGRILFTAAGAIIAMSMVVFLFKHRIFSLATPLLIRIFGIHMVRLVATTLLSAVMWHLALPHVALVWLILLATLQLLVTRLPFVPNKDLVFASLAIFMIGSQGELAPLIAMIAAAILAAHLIIGGFLIVADMLGKERTA